MLLDSELILPSVMLATGCYRVQTKVNIYYTQLLFVIHLPSDKTSKQKVAPLCG